MSEQVWVLVIDTDSGTDVTVWRDPDHARDHLHRYVVSQWRNWDDPDDPLPFNRDDAIEGYFDGHKSDWFTLNLVPIR